MTAIRVPHTERAYWVMQMLFKEMDDPVDSKPKLLKNEHIKVVDEDSEEKADPKTKLNSTDIKNSKKILDDKNLNKVNEEQAKRQINLYTNRQIDLCDGGTRLVCCKLTCYFACNHGKRW